VQKDVTYGDSNPKSFAACDHSAKPLYNNERMKMILKRNAKKKIHTTFLTAHAATQAYVSEMLLLVEFRCGVKNIFRVQSDLVYMRYMCDLRCVIAKNNDILKNL